jgi:Domain of unknown function (DUF4129)
MIKKYVQYIIFLIICFFQISITIAQESKKEVEPPYYNGDEEPTTTIERVVVESEYNRGYELRKFSEDRMEELKGRKEFQYDERKIEEQQKENEKNYNRENSGGGQSGSGSKEPKSRTREYETTRMPQNDTSVNWTWILIFFGIIVLGILLALGFKPSFLFRKNTSDINIGNKNEVDTEDINTIKFESELDKAIRLKNYKLAVRIMYLEVLKTLNDKQLIDWNKNKTNLDYVKEIKNTNLKADFRQITNSFDYVWYGNFNIDASTFNLMQDKIVSFKKRI